MVYEIQHFKVAELIFISNQDSGIVTPSERKEIKNRFESIVGSFLNEHDKDHNAGYVKLGKSGLPHNSIIKIDNKRMVLNYQKTFKEPMLFIFDFEKRVVCNYINIKDASFILNENEKMTTGTKCFEISFDDFSNIFE